ncbi:hypothetical protein ACGFWI_16565 [Streptomyces sp. NPDC048434]|uniref:hypothetical protein n=1 Tax=Streptomyces sp. NPDC048434 TaxID=3365549 RepID=UPI00372050CA
MAGRAGFVRDAVESSLPAFPGARTDFLYEAVSFGQGRDFGEALRALASALRSQCPEGRLELRGSLAGDAYDRYSDIDLLWNVPGERFAAAVAGAVKPGMPGAGCGDRPGLVERGGARVGLRARALAGRVRELVTAELD